MKFLYTTLALITLSFFSFTNIEDVSYKIDIDQSTVEWKASKVTGKHNGTIKIKEGDLTFTDTQLTGGTFTIDMTSVECSDLEGKSKESLEGHLKSPDFFGVEEFPTASFLIKQVVARGAEGDYKIIGDITIKGITKEIKFNTLLANNIATATIILDRTDFDVRYGSGSFFSNLGDKTIHDDFELNVSLAYQK